jgi:hypothetical protein
MRPVGLPTLNASAANTPCTASGLDGAWIDILPALKGEDSSPGGYMAWVSVRFPAGVPMRSAPRMEQRMHPVQQQIELHTRSLAAEGRLDCGLPGLTVALPGDTATASDPGRRGILHEGRSHVEHSST